MPPTIARNLRELPNDAAPTHATTADSLVGAAGRLPSIPDRRTTRPWTRKYGRRSPPWTNSGTRDSGRGRETLFGGYPLDRRLREKPTLAARPDNTGLVGMRHMLHVETDIYKQYLTFYTDQNFFSDRNNGWITLSEWDATFAFTGVIDRFNWRCNTSVMPCLDRRGLKQAYADAPVTARFRPFRIPTGGGARSPIKTSRPTQGRLVVSQQPILCSPEQHRPRPLSLRGPCRLPDIYTKQNRALWRHESIYRPGKRAIR